MATAAAIPVNLRIKEDIRSLIDRAARAQGRSRSDFMIEASRRAAEDVLTDQVVLRVDAETYDAFVVALDSPPAHNPELTRTMRSPAPWEKL